MMVRDLELANEFKELYLKPVFLYGAGVYGKKVLKILKDMGVWTKGFVDSNPLLKGEQLEGVQIYSVDELQSIAQNNEIIIIITAKEHSEQIIKILEKYKINCRNVYTLYGLFWAIYFNLDQQDMAQGAKDKFKTKLMAWLYNQKVELYYKQANMSLMRPLFLDEEENPIIIFQPGKVGSNTLKATLKAYGKPVVSCHGILFSSEYDGSLELKRAYIQALKSKKNIKMITLVREPISKDIGHFFQKIDFAENDVGWLIKGIMEKNFQTSFLNYLSMITPFDFTEKQNKVKFNEQMICHIDYIGKKSDKGALLGWYEEELLHNLDIDILDSDFDIDHGYGIMKCGNIELLILKLEKLNQLADVIGNFVGIEQLKLISVNQAINKSYKYAYKQFYEAIWLPKEYVDFYYQENEYLNHFYSDKERDEFYRKWSKLIK